VSPIKLPDGKQIQGRDEDPHPTGEQHWIDGDIGPRGKWAMHVANHPLKEERIGIDLHHLAG